MAEPILINADLDEIVSSDTYVPGEGTINTGRETALINAATNLPRKDFATYAELNVSYDKVKRSKVMISESASLTEAPIADAAAGSFGDQNLEMIIGNDDRKRVPDPTANPWRKLAALIITSKSGSQYAGTGWFISPNVLVTAGHCVFLHDAGGFAKEIEVIPCWNNNTRPFGSHKTKLFKSCNGWVNDRNSDYDYGLIVLNEHANPSIGYFAFAAAPDEYLNGKIVNVGGYPHDPDKWPNQYYHAREITRSSKHKIYYDADSTGGQSGAGLWLTLGEDQRVAVGIHTTGSSTTNFGTRITDPMFTNFKKIKDEYQ